MEDQEIDDILQEALKLHEEGKSYADIRAHFKDELSHDLISYIIRLVDELVIEENRIKEEIKKAKFKIYIGLVAFGLSSLLIYKFYTNDALSGFISLLAYLPMVFSLYLLWHVLSSRPLWLFMMHSLNWQLRESDGCRRF